MRCVPLSPIRPARRSSRSLLPTRGGVISDIAALADIAHHAGVPLIIDNTMATPYLCRPFEHGADLIVHSTTKFLSGHGNAMGGAVVDSGKFDWGQNDKFPSLSEPEPSYHGISFWESFGDLAFTTYGHAVGLRDLGPTMAPMNAYLTITGIETLPLRMERHVANASKVADFLDSHPAVSWVSYAGLKSSSYNALAEKYLPRGAGSVFTFGVKGGYEAGRRIVERVNYSAILRISAIPVRSYSIRPRPRIASLPKSKEQQPGREMTLCASLLAWKQRKTSSWIWFRLSKIVKISLYVYSLPHQPRFRAERRLMAS